MRFLVAAVAMTMVSTPAMATDMTASSRAIPPSESNEELDLVQDSASSPSGGREAAFAAQIPMKVGVVARNMEAVRPPLLRPAPDTADSDRDRQKTCIAQAVYYESKGEPIKGQRAVADVIINRTKRPGFASTPCGVIRQPHQFTNASRWKIPSSGDPLWQRAKQIASNALDGIERVSEVITHFHASRIRPGWSMRRVASIGGHIFY